MKSGSSDLSAYAIGAGIGALNAFAFSTAKRGLGVTSAFESTAAMAGRRIAPDVTGVNAYVKERDEVPKFDWESMLVVGLFAGSYLAAHLNNERTNGVLPPTWVRRFGPSRKKRYAGAFFGGAAMMFGARMAKGCTSGHAITGTMQLALSSWVFSPLMFATAALAARALYGKGER